MNRSEALTLIKQHTTKPNLIKHMLAVAAIMRAMAQEIIITERSEDKYSNITEGQSPEAKDKAKISEAKSLYDKNREAISKEEMEQWELVGLLHDIDFEKTQNNPEMHTIEAEKILSEEGLSDDFIKTIKTHNYEHTKLIPETKLEKALLIADNVSGLIIAAALIIPSKKLSDLTVETINNKFKDKSFARQCDRSRIQVCKHINISLERLFEISLKALQEISDELGL